MARRDRPRLLGLLPVWWAFASCGAVPSDTVAELAPATRHVRVAICQIEVTPEPEVNLGRIEAAIAEAAARRADLACFPEACVFGWVNPTAHRAAATIPGATTDRIGESAARHGVMVALGLAEREGDRLYNSVVLIDVDGRVLLRHRKVNILTELMDPPYACGTGANGSVIDTRFGRIGLLICADTFLEPVVDQLAGQDPDLVLVPYGWAAPAAAWPGHGESLSSWVAHTARRCNAPVVGTDSTGQLHFGPWKDQVLGGQSVVCAADGRVLDVLPDRRPGIRVFDIELGPAKR